MAFTPQYLTTQDVKNFLYGKVSFGDNVTTSITDDFLNTLISYAEAEVCRRLNKFYVVPLMNRDGGAYSTLPQETRAYIERLMINLSVIYVLDCDFAKTGTNIADNYRKLMNEQYYTSMNSNFKRDETGRFNLPPLPDLQINYKMYTGITVMPTPMVVGNRGIANLQYAINQVTKPWLAWWSFYPYGDFLAGNNIINSQ